MTGKEEFWMILGPFLANQGQRKKNPLKIRIFGIFFSDEYEDDILRG